MPKIEKYDIIETKIDLPLTPSGTQGIVLGVFPHSEKVFIFDNEEGYTVPVTAIKKVDIDVKTKRKLKRNSDVFLEYYYNKMKIDPFENLDERYDGKLALYDITDEDIERKINKGSFKKRFRILKSMFGAIVDDILFDFLPELDEKEFDANDLDVLEKIVDVLRDNLTWTPYKRR